MGPKRIFLWACFVAAACGWCAAAPAAGAEPEGARKRRIEAMVGYYTRMYSKHLASGDWFVRALSVVALAKIDAAPTTAKLLAVLAGDRSALVRVYAWEALHARTRSLTDAQRTAWLEGGLAAAVMGGFCGDLRVGLLKALEPGGPKALDGRGKALANAWAAKVRRDEPTDAATIAQLKRLDEAWRAGIGGGRYRGRSKYIPPAESIDNPSDPKWRKDLELERLQIQDFDLVFCIDATGSMQRTMDWIARDVTRVMAALRLVAREPRIGAVYFRHEVLAELLKPCCKKCVPRGRHAARIYRTRALPLTGNIPALSRAMRAQEGGRNSTDMSAHPGGAVHGGLSTALKVLPWSQKPTARKIVVLVGDSPVTPGTQQTAEALAAEARKRGWVVHAIVILRGKNASHRLGSIYKTYKGVADAGGGQTIRIQEDRAAGRPGKADKKKPAGKKGRKNPPAEPAETRTEQASSYQQVVGAILRSTLPAGYHDRVDPLVRVLLVYAEANPNARR